MDWCRLCKENFELSRISKQKTPYCSSCRSKISSKEFTFNKYGNKESFYEFSFKDVVDKDWTGFRNLGYDPHIISNITTKFSSLKYICSFKYEQKALFSNLGDKIIYLCSNDTILKVGQTTNIKSRFHHYSYLGNPNFDIFEAQSWKEQDLYEHKLRNYLEFLGYRLPEDNTNCRLKYII